MSRELKTETIPVRAGDRKTDSTTASRLAEATLRKIRAVQEAAAQQARRELSRPG